MSVLSERDIIRELGRKIIVLPFSNKEDNLRGCDIKLKASRFAYIFEKSSPNFPHPNRCKVNGEVLLIPAHKTAIVWTEEFIYINNSLCGSLHSKVKLVSKGLGHIGTRVNPNWGGILAIALHNHSSSDIEIGVGDDIAYLRLHRLTSKSYAPRETGGKLADVTSDGYVPPKELQQWLEERHKTWEENDVETFCKKYRNHIPYQDAMKEYQDVLRRLDFTRWNQSVWIIITAIGTLLAPIVTLLLAPKNVSPASTSTKLEDVIKSPSDSITPKIGK